MGNSSVIAVTYKNNSRRKVINYLILNMAVSDLLLPLFALPRRIKHIHFPRGFWLVGGAFGSITCKLIPFAEDLSLAVSILTLELIAIERFFCIVLPMRKEPISDQKRCFFAIACTWFVGVLYPSVHLYKQKVIYKDTTPYCVSTWEPAFNNVKGIKIQFPIFLVCFTIFPFVLLTSLYSAIIVSLHRQKARLHLASKEMRRRAKENRRVTYMVTAAVIVFFVAWTPLNVYMFLSSYVWKSQRPCDSRHLIFSAIFFQYTYSALNPIIYYFFNENYRNSFQGIICRKFTHSRICCKSQVLPAATKD